MAAKLSMQEDELAENSFPSDLRFSFTKSSRLLNKKDFQMLFQKANCFTGRSLLFFWKKRESPNAHSRLGITVTKKYGKAVERNHFKRLVREAFRQLRYKAPFAIDIHARPKKDFEAITFLAVCEDFTNFFSSLQRHEPFR